EGHPALHSRPAGHNKGDPPHRPGGERDEKAHEQTAPAEVPECETEDSRQLHIAHPHPSWRYERERKERGESHRGTEERANPRADAWPKGGRDAQQHDARRERW